MNPIPSDLPAAVFEAAISELVRRLLAHGDDIPGRCRPQDLQRILADYPATFIPLPAVAFDHTDVVAVTATPGKWSIRQPMWSKEEGRSDLELWLTATTAPDGRLTVQIDDLLVP
jgi:hypothetical protein